MGAALGRAGVRPGLGNLSPLAKRGGGLVRHVRVLTPHPSAGTPRQRQRDSTGEHCASGHQATAHRPSSGTPEMKPHPRGAAPGHGPPSHRSSHRVHAPSKPPFPPVPAGVAPPPSIGPCATPRGHVDTHQRHLKTRWKTWFSGENHIVTKHLKTKHLDQVTRGKTILQQVTGNGAGESR